MDTLIQKYADKLVAHHLCPPGQALLGAVDAEIYWNRDAPEQAVLETVMAGLNISAILLARPAEPYQTALGHLTAASPTAVYPDDCETRTFLHDIPVVPEFAPEPIIRALKNRKGVLVAGRGIITIGTVSPEQTFVVFSSICFAGFVKFFTEALPPPAGGIALNHQLAAFAEQTVLDYKARVQSAAATGSLRPGPLDSPDQIQAAIIEAGRMIVAAGLVDSFFGNVSARLENTIYISQTGSSLDELSGVIDACPRDNSSCAGLTASSELSAHQRIYAADPEKYTILHGHPRFAVVMSMSCAEPQCPHRGQCAVKCDRARSVGGVPIVPGEVGTGRHGLCHTLPPAIAGKPGAIVYGHGLFTTGRADFREAMAALIDIELRCADIWLETFKQEAVL